MLSGSAKSSNRSVSYTETDGKYFVRVTFVFPNNLVEAGLKGVLPDGQLAFAAALYTLEWENQTSTYQVNWDGPWNDPADPAFNGVEYPTADISEPTTLNEGSVGITGIEFEGTYFINDAWSINGNLSVMDSQYDEFCDVLATGGNFREPIDGVAPITGVGCHK